MPVREIPMDVVLPPPPPAKCKQPGVTQSLLYNGSCFKGHQKSKGNQYDVEVLEDHDEDVTVYGGCIYDAEALAEVMFI